MSKVKRYRETKGLRGLKLGKSEFEPMMCHLRTTMLIQANYMASLIPLGVY